ncbi:replication-associated protein [Circoviridae 21 LDMD-2013]|uniref:replication-associated protein n=1 Tax=Circoviridae 21 LDMD-2013 TaxID=1379725 RepID=UPI000384747E|nr:replication-associated protein [Circoviridae 21 LDMD-2013]AGS36240.1 replication-associated protein [Circoviridae 21 LDMD-2013]
MPRTRTTTPETNMRRNWCITVNNPVEDPETWSKRLRTHSLFKYLVFQAEKGDSGTIHYQAYAEFSNPIRFGSVKYLIPGAHIEARRGSAKQASDYCKKEKGRKAGPWEYGELSVERQGQRLDLERLAQIAQTHSHTDILKEMPREYAKYYKFVQHVKHIEAMDKPGIRSNLQVIVCHGETRTGKTHYAYERDPNLYALPVGKDLWFDNYNGEKTVLLDDFSGQCRLVDLLRILDKYPVQIPRKGGFVWLKAETIIITCNQHPETWYDYSNRDSLRKALMARFTRFLEFTAGGRKAIQLGGDHTRPANEIVEARRDSTTPIPETPPQSPVRRDSDVSLTPTIELSTIEDDYIVIDD